MSTITFDTHKFIRKLKESGIVEAQGEANLATKQDLEVAVKTLEANLVRWIVGAGFLQSAIIAGLLIKLIK